MGSTVALEEGRWGRNEVSLESLWAGCPRVKIRTPTRQLSACSFHNALWSPSSGLEMPPVFQAGVGTTPVLPYACVNHSFIKHSSSHPRPTSLQGWLAFLPWLWYSLIKSSKQHNEVILLISFYRLCNWVSEGLGYFPKTWTCRISNPFLNLWWSVWWRVSESERERARAAQLIK